MKRIHRPNRPAVLVSWVSVRHGAAGLLEALGEPASPLARGCVSRLYLCWREVAGQEGDDERRALADTSRALERELRPTCPEIIKLSWRTDRPPIDHAAIRPFAENVLRNVRADNPEAHIFIHVSAGTPAMHAVWLVLGATGLVDGPVTLIHGIESKHRQRGASPVALVNFELDTWLRRYRQARPQAPRDDDDGQLWDPSHVRSPALRAALAAALRYAPLRAPVLLLGERGTGKTTLANLIRSRSPHQRLGDRPWPVVVCGQFRGNPQLARSDLFGHKRGAFTGATTDRTGLIEEADGDTLFLDEVADLDHDTQRLLIAAVEGRGFHRLGDPQVRHSRFRLISATNRRFVELRDGLLDLDFLDRLAVFVIDVPPLRDCAEDIPELWTSVVRRAALAEAIDAARWRPFVDAPAILEALRAHPLPGNLRDLQRVAYHLVAALEAGEPSEHCIEQAVAALEDRRRDGQTSIDPISLPIEDLRVHLDAYRQRWIDAAMSTSSGNQSEAARLLGVPRATLRDWLSGPR
ncbi:sigma-54-dependent transcriptional regulator [Nannocystis pusilla]|uniref:sigma-54-dependent transcriptional regulator n=1 Tax=Nannocystis pusilla TaxID=889268 RepID=UPI003DA3607D